MTDLRSAMLSLKANVPMYLENEAYYSGTRTEVFASEKARHDLEESGRNYRINFAATAVDAITERLETAGIVCSDEGAREFLNTVWEDNFFDAELKDAFTMAGKYGDAYMIAWPDDEETSGVSVYTHPPMSVRVFYDELRPRRKYCAVHVASIVGNEDNDLTTGERYLLVTLYYVDRVEKHVSEAPLPRKGGVDYEKVKMRLLEDPIPNPYGIIPVFHFRTGRPYGVSDLEAAKGPQDAISKIFITMLTAIDRAGYRQRYAITDKPAGSFRDNFSQSAPDDATPTDAVPGLNVTQGHQAGPGTEFLYSGSNVKVGTFEVSESSNFLQPINEILGWMSRVTDIPTHYFTTGAVPPSGASYRNGERPLLKRVQDRQVIYGSTLKELFAFCLQTRGMGKVEAEVAWAPIQIEDSDFWDVQTIKKELNVPNKVLLVEGGYTQEDIDAWAQDQETEPGSDLDVVEDILPNVPPSFEA